MKQTLSILILLAVVTASMAQVPQLVEYTAILRDSTNAKIANREVSLRFSIVTDTATNQVVFQEVHTDTTDASGLISLQLGSGSAVSGSLDSARWDTTAHFLRTEVDFKGGSSYTVTGHTRLLSVPYAKHATMAGVVDTIGSAEDIELRVSEENDTLFFGTSGQYVVIPGISPIPALPNGYVPCDSANLMVINTVVSAGGKVWLDRNLGASQVATASDDTLAYGDLYQWGRFAEGHQCRESESTIQLATTSAVSSDDAWYGKHIKEGSTDWLSTKEDDLWQGVNGTNNPCPEGFRLPTNAEWQAERESWIDKNSTGAISSPLKMPVAGRRGFNSGAVENAGTYSYYWSSSVNGDSARNLWFGLGSDESGLSSSFRAFGFSVRCIKD